MDQISVHDTCYGHGVEIHKHDQIANHIDIFECVAVYVEYLTSGYIGCVKGVDDQGRHHFLWSGYLPKCLEMAHKIAEDIEDKNAAKYLIYQYHTIRDDDKAVDIT